MLENNRRERARLFHHMHELRGPDLKGEYTDEEIQFLQEEVGDVWGPDARVWDWLLKAYAGEFQETATDTGAKFTYDQAINALQTARATQSWLDRRLDFNDKPRRGEIEPQSQFLWFLSMQVEASEDVYAPFLKFNFATDHSVPQQDARPAQLSFATFSSQLQLPPASPPAPRGLANRSGFRNGGCGVSCCDRFQVVQVARLYGSRDSFW